MFSVIRSARDNALHVRGNLSADVWESINLAWMELKELRHKGVTESNASRVFDWTRERSNVFRGAAYGTLLRNDAFHFLLLGTFIERADATARVLNIRHHMATKSLKGTPPSRSSNGRRCCTRWPPLRPTRTPTATISNR